jgi:hypothetical protein
MEMLCHVGIKTTQHSFSDKNAEFQTIPQGCDLT